LHEGLQIYLKHKHVLLLCFQVHTAVGMKNNIFWDMTQLPSKELKRKLVTSKQQTTKDVCIGILNYLTESIHKTLGGKTRRAGHCYATARQTIFRSNESRHNNRGNVGSGVLYTVRVEAGSNTSTVVLRVL
jgi:hypothetical protein